MRYLVSRAGVPRLGTAEDIASAAAWLAGSEASFITGIDLLVDGGVVAAMTSA
jgi:NAD(P)-dependent dehydrogenase (short-subunit alcohol dehydrogenase family)